MVEPAQGRNRIPIDSLLDDRDSLFDVGWASAGRRHQQRALRDVWEWQSEALVGAETEGGRHGERRAASNRTAVQSRSCTSSRSLSGLS